MSHTGYPKPHHSWGLSPDFITNVKRCPSDTVGVALGKITAAAHEVKVMIDSPLRFLVGH
jgi:hypothetical protein